MLVILIMNLLVGCSNKKNESLNCVYTETRGVITITETTILEHKNGKMIKIKQGTESEMELDEIEDFVERLKHDSYIFNSIQGIDIDIEINDDKTSYIYSLLIDFKILDYDALEKLLETINYDFDIKVSQDYKLSDYKEMLEERGRVCN